MPDTIERTIYKLELDGSAYLAGVDSLSNSTKKLSDAQDKANLKLAELQKQHNAYKKNLAEVTAVLQANEKETLDLTKQLNALKDAKKGTTAEANRLKAALRDIATNTKEFKIEAGVLKDNLTATTNQIRLQAKEVKAAETANGGFTKSLSGMYGGLSRIAAFIPGLGIGGLVALISGPVINAFQEWYDSVNKTSDSLKILQATQESFKGGESAYIKASESVNELRINIDLAKDGFIDKDKVVNQYNETVGKTAGTVKTLDEVEQKLVEHGDAYIQMMLLKAAANFALGEAAKSAFEAEEKRKKEAEEFITGGRRFENFIAQFGAGTGAGRAGDVAKENERLRKEQNEKDKKAAIKDSDDRTKTFTDIAKKFQEDAANIAKEHGFNFFETKTTKPKTETGRKDVENIYEIELQKLKANIAKLDEKGFTDESTITKAVEEDFKKRSLAFDKAFKNKQLTSGQLASLKEFLGQEQDLVLNAALKDFHDKRAAYLKKIEDEIFNIQSQDALKRISNIQDNFERQRQTILAETDKLIKAKEKSRDSLIADIKKSNILDPEQVQAAITKVNTATDSFIEQVKIHSSQQLQKLSFDTFEKLSEDVIRTRDAGNLGVSQGSLINIQEQTKLLQEGKISYKQWQEEITEIAKREVNARFLNEKRSLEEQIKLKEDKLFFNVSLTPDQQKRLEDEIRRLKQQLIDLEKGNLTATGKGLKPEDNERLQKILKYADAIGAVVNSVIQFWQAANKAESEALDRSISLQEKRVSAAQKIAERGNAQYLKAEEDRLTELNVKRENAARKQLGIDAALQASQILVGITGAIAKIATPGIGIAETIGAIAIIVGALATGYGLVKSLQGNQPTLFKGTPHLERNGHPAGRDTIPAWLNEGEAVIPTEKNKKYKKSVEAIYHGKVPAEVLNEFVENYVRNKVEKTSKENVIKDKKIVEKSDIINTVHKVLNEVSDKKTNTRQLNSIINKKEDKQTIESLTVENIFNLINNRLNKTVNDLQDNKYSLVVDKIFSENKNLVQSKNISSLIYKVVNETSKKDISVKQISSFIKSIEDKKTSNVIQTVSENISKYKNFVQNVSKVPDKILNGFIENYSQRKLFKGTTDLQGQPGIDKIPVWASKGEAIIPKTENNLYKPVVNAIFEGAIPPEHLNAFVKNYHQIKSVPLPDYSRIKESAELKMGQDGRMSVLLTENNKKLDEQNSLQRQVIRHLKNMGVNVSLDQNGFAVTQMEVMEQMRINKNK